MALFLLYVYFMSILFNADLREHPFEYEVAMCVR
jgi:hypothetical protein